MNKKFITLPIILFSAFITTTGVFFLSWRRAEPALSAASTSLPLVATNATTTPPVTKKIQQSVPFTSQAPFGQWKEEIFQDGCEEASALMAMSWVQGTVLDAKNVSLDIRKLVDFEKHSPTGYRPDLSASDTAELIKSYFHYPSVTVREIQYAKDIISELAKGNIIIAPMNGQLLHNPYYSPPGPPYHMLVVIGYDPTRDEFITNDPGTRHGAQFHYPSIIFMKALRDYPSGHNRPRTKIIKRIIVVRKTI